MKGHALAIHGQGDRGNLALVFPQRFAGLRIDGDQRALLAIPVELGGDATLIALLFDGELAVQTCGVLVDEHVENAVTVQDLLRTRRAFVLMEGLTRGTADAGDGSCDAEGGEDFVITRDEAAGKLGGAGFQGPKVGAPLFDGPFPKDRSVERIAGDEVKLGRQKDGDPRAFVHDVVDAPGLGNHGAHGGHPVMVPAPAGAADPLHAFGWSHEVVLGGRVALGIVIVVRPVVHSRRALLGGLYPRVSIADHGHSIRGQDTLDLPLGHGGGVLNDEEVHKVFDIGQGLAVPLFDGHRAVAVLFQQRFAGGIDGGRVRVQPLDLIAFVELQGGGFGWIGGTDVNDESSLNTGVFNDGGEICPGEGGDGECSPEKDLERRGGFHEEGS